MRTMSFDRNSKGDGMPEALQSKKEPWFRSATILDILRRYLPSAAAAKPVYCGFSRYRTKSNRVSQPQRKTVLVSAPEIARFATLEEVSSKVAWRLVALEVTSASKPRATYISVCS